MKIQLYESYIESHLSECNLRCLKYRDENKHIYTLKGDNGVLYVYIGSKEYVDECQFPRYPNGYFQAFIAITRDLNLSELMEFEGMLFQAVTHITN